MSMFRVYFFDLDSRKELVEHPLNGKTWLGTSSMAVGRDGKFIKDTCTEVRVASYASLHSVKGEQAVTVDTFPGQRIAVKIWFGPGEVEWRKLVRDERACA